MHRGIHHPGIFPIQQIPSTTAEELLQNNFPVENRELMGFMGRGMRGWLEADPISGWVN